MVNMERISALDDAESLAKEMAAILAKLPGEWLIAECALLSIFSAAQKGAPADRMKAITEGGNVNPSGARLRKHWIWISSCSCSSEGLRW
jgi:hypothetical protein